MKIVLKNLSDRKQKGKFKTGYLLIENYIMRFENKDLIGDPFYVTGTTEFEIIQDFKDKLKDEFEEDIPKVIYFDDEGKYDAHHVLDERRLIIKKEDDDMTYDEIKDREDYIEYKFNHC